MTTAEIIEQFSNLKIEDSDDYENLERIDELTDRLRQNPDGHLACKEMINLLERHPEVDFGSPGEPIHTLEFFKGNYEDFLFDSLNRRPTQMTVWMYNRIINIQSGNERKKMIEHLKSYIDHPLADVEAVQSAKNFYKYQTGE
uniref:hypothetical protein n=1 Tax=Pedobacter schmidteae TaxID=2201271 RepID=UPI000EB427F5|nr:hypothetical protein [Pedobacter schmidteae]